MSKEQNRFSRLLKKYKEGYISVSIYLNVTTSGKRYYDTVIHRKIKSSGKPEGEWKRGTNLKPQDIPILMQLLEHVDEFLKVELKAERGTAV